MPAVTVNERKRDKGDVWVGVRMEASVIAAPADLDTYDVSDYFEKVHAALVSFNDAAVAATDAVAVTWSGTTITFKVVGVGRQVALLVIGE